MKRRIIMFFVVLTLLIATTCMLTACGGSELKQGNSVVDVTDVEVQTDGDGDITGTKYQDKKIEVSYLVGDNSYIQLSGNKTSEMKVSGYSGAVTTLSLKDIEEKVKVDGENVNVNGIASGAFAGCETLTSVDLSKTNEALNFNIDDGAFMSCTNLTSVVLPDKVYSNENRIGEASFFNCSALNIVTGMDKFPILDTRAFSDCANLETVQLSSNTTYIPANLFANCEKLANITLPTSLKVIDDSAFHNSAVTNIDFSTLNNLLSIGNNAFREAKLTSVNLPDSILFVGNGAFYDNKLTSVNIPFLGNRFIQDSQWRFNSVYGAEYDNPKPDLDNYGEYIYPEYTKTDVTVRNANGLDNINFSDSTVSKLHINFAPIGEKVIYMADAIDRDLGNNIVAKDIVTYTLTKTKIDKLPDKLPDNFLSNARLLESLTIPNITKIGTKAFANTAALKDISNIFNDNIKSVGDAAFEGSGVENVVIPDNIINFGNGIFDNCNELTAITFNKFYDDASMMSKIYGTSVPKNLTTINLGEKITDIPNKAFMGLIGLTTVNMSDNIENIGLDAFSGCIALPGYYNAVTILNNWVVKKNDSISNVVLPTSVVGLAYGTIDSSDNIFYSGTEKQFKAIKNTNGINYPADITLYAEGEIVEENGIMYYLDATKHLCVLAVNSNDRIITIKNKVKIGEVEYNVSKLMNGAFFNKENDVLFLPASVVETESNPFASNTIKAIEYAGTLDQYNSLAASGNFSMVSSYSTNVKPTDSYTYVVKENGTEIFRTTSLYIDYTYDKIGYRLVSAKVGAMSITFPFKAEGIELGKEVVIDLVTVQLKTPDIYFREPLVVNDSFIYTFDRVGDEYSANNLGIDNSTAIIEFTAENYVAMNMVFSIKSEGNYDKVTVKIVDQYGRENQVVEPMSGTVNKSVNVELNAGQKLVVRYSKDSSNDPSNEKACFSYTIYS